MAAEVSQAETSVSSKNAEDVAVEITGVRKAFGDVVAVDSIDLTIRRGEIVGIIGPSGSGKTTLIRLLLGFYKPTRGDVRVLGNDPSGFSRLDREDIGYLPQHFLLYPELTVKENLEFVAGSYGIGWRKRGRRICELLEMVDLADAANRLAENISGGMQRRLALASSMIHEPGFLVLDEPTAGIDPVLRARVWELFRGLQAEGRTLIVTTQYVTESEFCDRVVLVNDGRVIAVGTPDELRAVAFGGEVVRATITDLDRELTRQILDYPFVISGEREGDEDLLIVVDDAGESIPMIMDRVQSAGRRISLIEEFRPTFDRVFVDLVEKQEKDVQPPS